MAAPSPSGCVTAWPSSSPPISDSSAGPVFHDQFRSGGGICPYPWSVLHGILPRSFSEKDRPMLIEAVENRTIDFAEAYRTANPAQREAIDRTEGAVLVVAGPGTGKTQIIAARIAKIIQQ